MFCYKVGEMKMSVNKMDIFEKLVEGYVKAPPSFQEQAITTLAIQLCQNLELKKGMIYQSGPLLYVYVSWEKWEKFIEEWSINMCQKLQLPHILKNKLISRLRVIALQVYNWSIEQYKFYLSPFYVNSCLIPSDWTIVEMRLDEKKIAKRLVQDERIPLYQRYRMACFHCLVDIIPSLWNQIPHERLCKNMVFCEVLELPHLWHLHLDEFFEKLLSIEEQFWNDLLIAGVRDGSRSTVIYCWSKLDKNARHEILKHSTGGAMELLFTEFRESDADIFCFLLMQMTKVQRVELFQEIFQNPEINIFLLFLRWPYLDLFVPIIKELWNVLPEVKYEELLLNLANIYSDNCKYNVVRKDYLDCEYGSLIIDLLDETPDHFKRYVFGNKYQEDINLFVEDGVLYNLLNMGHHNIHYREVFKHIWKHVTLEEKIFFLRSHHGKRLCCNLVTQDNCELFTSILRDCLPEGEIPIFKKAVLDMKSGNVYSHDK